MGDEASGQPIRPPSRDATRRLVAMLLPVALIGVAVCSLGRPMLRSEVQPLPLVYRVDVNAAGFDELSLLPGVGPGVAEHIIRYRERVGPFRSAEDLERVRMIGPVTRARIEPWVVFGEAFSGSRGPRDHRPPSPQAR